MKFHLPTRNSVYKECCISAQFSPPGKVLHEIIMYMLCTDEVQLMHIPTPAPTTPTPTPHLHARAGLARFMGVAAQLNSQSL